MAERLNNETSNGSAIVIDPELVRFVVIYPGRRRMLVALASGKPLAPSQLTAAARATVENTFKQLEKMRAAGLVTRKPDPTDARRWLYELDPCVPVKDTPNGRMIDFGYVAIPVSSVRHPA